MIHVVRKKVSFTIFDICLYKFHKTDVVDLKHNYIYIYEYIYIYIYMNIYICMYIYICVCVCVCIHTHTRCLQYIKYTLFKNM